MQKQTENIVILGMGVSGLSAARYFSAQGKNVQIVDSRSQPPLLEQFRNELPNMKYHLGGFDQHIINGASELILSPGLAKSEVAIQQALNLGIPVVGDVEVFARTVQAPIIAITGSNGKSTVTRLVTLMAQAAKIDAVEGGNIGIPVLDLIAAGEQAETQFYVLELSSFQLETTKSLRAHASVVLNLSPDHMDRYESFDDYCQAKMSIYQGCRYSIFNLDDATLQIQMEKSEFLVSFSLQDESADFYLHKASAQLMHGEESIISIGEMKLQGMHNCANALAACALAHTMGVSKRAMAETLRSYPGLPHRTQLVCNRHEIKWFNDSKGTNVGASCAAIQSVGGLPGVRKLVLIAGGVGKGADYQPLLEVCQQFVSAVVLMGEDADLLQDVLQTGSFSIHRAADMQQAVTLAAEFAAPGDAVLLSPAGASFDFYRNYMERGDHFEKLLKDLE